MQPKKTNENSCSCPCVRCIPKPTFSETLLHVKCDIEEQFQRTKCKFQTYYNDACELGKNASNHALEIREKLSDLCVKAGVSSRATKQKAKESFQIALSKSEGALTKLKETKNQFLSATENFKDTFANSRRNYRENREKLGEALNQTKEEVKNNISKIVSQISLFKQTISETIINTRNYANKTAEALVSATKLNLCKLAEFLRPKTCTDRNRICECTKKPFSEILFDIRFEFKNRFEEVRCCLDDCMEETKDEIEDSIRLARRRIRAALKKLEDTSEETKAKICKTKEFIKIKYLEVRVNVEDVIAISKENVEVYLDFVETRIESIKESVEAAKKCLKESCEITQKGCEIFQLTIKTHFDNILTQLDDLQLRIWRFKVSVDEACHEFCENVGSQFSEHKDLTFETITQTKREIDERIENCKRDVEEFWMDIKSKIDRAICYGERQFNFILNEIEVIQNRIKENADHAQCRSKKEFTKAQLKVVGFLYKIVMRVDEAVDSLRVQLKELQDKHDIDDDDDCSKK